MELIMLTEKQIRQFQIIYKEVFGRSISRKMAYDQAIKLINFAKATIEHTAKTHKVDKAETQQDNIC